MWIMLLCLCLLVLPEQHLNSSGVALCLLFPPEMNSHKYTLASHLPELRLHVIASDLLKLDNLSVHLWMGFFVIVFMNLHFCRYGSCALEYKKSFSHVEFSPVFSKLVDIYLLKVLSSLPTVLIARDCCMFIASAFSFRKIKM